MIKPAPEQAGAGFLHQIGDQECHQQRQAEAQVGIGVLPGGLRRHVGVCVHGRGDAQPLQVHRQVLMDQVIIHRHGGQFLHDPVAHEEPHGLHREGQGQHQPGESQGEHGAAGHLPGLDSGVVPGGGLGLEDQDQRPHASSGGGGGHQLPGGAGGTALHPPVSLGHADIDQRGQHAQGVHVQEGGQLVDDHGVILQGPQAPAPPQPGDGGHGQEGGFGAFHGGAGQEWIEQVRLHLNGEGPAGHADGGADVGIGPEGQGEGQVGEHVLDHALGIGVQVPGDGHEKQHDEGDKIEAGHHAHDALSVELAPVGDGGALQHTAGVGQKQQECAEKDGAVHGHVA